MSYSLIMEDGTVVRKSETLVNFVRNCFFDLSTYYEPFTDMEKVGNSFRDKKHALELREYNTIFRRFAYEYVLFVPKYIVIDGDGKLVPKCRMQKILDKLEELCTPKKLFKGYLKAKDCPGFRFEPVSHTGRWRRNSPQHYGKIGIVPETRELEAYELYRKEHPEYRLPKSRYGDLPKGWDITHKYNVRGERDWKRTKVRKQWMKEHRNNCKKTGIHMQKERSIKDLGQIQEDDFFQIDVGICDDFFSKNELSHEEIKNFEENYKEDIDAELKSPEPFDIDARSTWDSEYSHYNYRFHEKLMEAKMEEPYAVIRDWHYWQDRYYGYAA